MNSLFARTLARQNHSPIPPIWFMRQAGRYHAHYQALRKDYSFLDLCRNPEISAEAAMGPIRDFDFDAAILFSDILFPLEAMGISLDFNPAPQLGRLLREPADLQHYQPTQDVAGFFGFQADALQELRRQLPTEKGLIGFVGGALTLYQFAAEGSGKQEFDRSGLTDGRFQGFMEKLLPLLAENMAIQAEAGIDCMAILDSSAGILSLAEYETHYLPYLQQLLALFRARCPQIPVLYYSKGTDAGWWRLLKTIPIQGLGIDYHMSLPEALNEFGAEYAIQGNIPPEWMNLEWTALEPKLLERFAAVKALPLSARKGWICGLGHGILPQARQENVRHFVQLARRFFSAEIENDYN
jgi:uroporphyrinogen decarboxylase